MNLRQSSSSLFFVHPFTSPSVSSSTFINRFKCSAHSKRKCIRLKTKQHCVKSCVDHSKPGQQQNAEQREQEVTPLYEMRNVSFLVPNTWDVMLFKNMNFHINPGEFVIMIGPNGSGKSTAIKIMLGLEKAFRGAKYFWRGKRVKPDKMFEYCGIVLQDPRRYFLRQRVLDEFRMLRPEVTPDDIRNVLESVGLTDISLMSDPRSLSGGQIRRLAVADQLLKSPKPQLFLMDEPLAGVDWIARKDIVKFMEEMKAKMNVSILLISHEPGDFLRFADRVVEIKHQAISNVSNDIIQRAIVTRDRLKIEKRLKAKRDAELFRLNMEKEEKQKQRQKDR